MSYRRSQGDTARLRGMNHEQELDGIREGIQRRLGDARSRRDRGHTCRRFGIRIARHLKSAILNSELVGGTEHYLNSNSECGGGVLELLKPVQPLLSLVRHPLQEP